MAGNVYEWCADCFKTDYYTLKDAKKNPQGPDEEDAEECDFSEKMSKARVLRGGNWNNNSGNCRMTNRNHNYPSNRNNNYGFRMVVLPAARWVQSVRCRFRGVYGRRGR